MTAETIAKISTAAIPVAAVTATIRSKFFTIAEVADRLDVATGQSGGGSRPASSSCTV